MRGDPPTLGVYSRPVFLVAEAVRLGCLILSWAKLNNNIQLAKKIKLFFEKSKKKKFAPYYIYIHPPYAVHGVARQGVGRGSCQGGGWSGTVAGHPRRAGIYAAADGGPCEARPRSVAAAFACELGTFSALPCLNISKLALLTESKGLINE